MTRKERAQVVEVLRCVYDIPHVTCSEDSTLGIPPEIHATVMRAVKLTRQLMPYDGQIKLRDACLEAARRIEEGWTP